MEKTISEVTRRDIIDTIRVESISWSGRLSESDFLSRLYDLDNMPSYDSRFKSARGDIWQHRENNPLDWPDDWIFDDSRFDLFKSDEVFLKFICEMLHPIIRPDVAESEKLQGIFNEYLAKDGWSIVEQKRISGKPVFTARQLNNGLSDIIKTVSTVSPTEDEEKRLWEPEFLRVFLSHKSEYKKKAAQLKDACLFYGMSCFVAHEDIEPNKEWQNEIERALFSMEIMIALMTEKFSESNWTDQEIDVAFGRKVPVISVQLGRDPYGFIGKFQAVDGKGKNSENLAKELFELILFNSNFKGRVVISLISCFENAKSFDHANKLMLYLEKVETATPDIIDRLESAPKNNSQLSGAFQVKDRLPGLLKKLREKIAR